MGDISCNGTSVLCECINNTENVAVLGFEWNLNNTENVAVFGV